MIESFEETHLDLLHFTGNLWGRPSLKNVAIIGAQHLMESTLNLFHFLTQTELSPNLTFLLGKCYSTSKSVYQDFVDANFNVSPLSFHFDSHCSFDESYQHNINQFLQDSLAKIDFDKVNKLIVLDDGGYLISSLAHCKLPNIPVIAIEQTSSGIHHLKKHTLTTPVINVARSKAKLELETPFIIEYSLKKLYEYIPLRKLAGRTVLILGFGAIGTGVAKALENICQVKVFDPAFTDQFLLIEYLKIADVVIGCSGTTSLKHSQYKYLKKNAILVSFSSSDREFEAHKFRQLFPQTDNPLSSFNSKVQLIQCGFPINFWQSRNNMPLDKIQITLSLLQSAIYQSINKANFPNEIIDFDPEIEQQIISGFRKIINSANVKESLARI